MDSVMSQNGSYCSLSELENAVSVLDFRSLLGSKDTGPELFHFTLEAEEAIKTCCRKLGIIEYEIHQVEVP